MNLKKKNGMILPMAIQTCKLPKFALKGIPWLSNIDGAICFLCKVDMETARHFLLDCPNCREHFDSLWANLTVKVAKFNDIDGRQISELLANWVDTRKRCYSWGVFLLTLPRLP